MPRPGRGPGGGHHGHGYFRGRGYRMTGPRRLILEVLESADEYLSAEEIYMEVYRRQPGIGIATVYRTLQLLSEVGTAQRVNTGDGKARYKLAPAGQRRQRVILVCTSCARTIPVPELDEQDRQRIVGLEESMNRRHGFAASNSLVQLFGRCAECDRTQPGSRTTTGSAGSTGTNPTEN